MSEELQIVEYEGIRVVTTKQIAEMYGTDSKTVSHNFNRNKERYTEGKHYFLLVGDKLRSFRQNGEYSIKAPKLYLWTERGALLLAKSINTDIAWQAYERLVDFYFEVKENKSEIVTPIEELPEEPLKITYQTSSTPVPKNPSWYERNKRRMNWMCQVNGKSLSSLYHMILVRLGEEYDLNAANRIYEQEKGKLPTYPMDIVNYFPDLARMADTVLDATEKRILENLSKRK